MLVAWLQVWQCLLDDRSIILVIWTFMVPWVEGLTMLTMDAQWNASCSSFMLDIQFFGGWVEDSQREERRRKMEADPSGGGERQAHLWEKGSRWQRRVRQCGCIHLELSSRFYHVSEGRPNVWLRGWSSIYVVFPVPTVTISSPKAALFYLCFSCQGEQYLYNRLPFSYPLAQHTFPKCMETALEPVSRQGTRVCSTKMTESLWPPPRRELHSTQWNLYSICKHRVSP